MQAAVNPPLPPRPADQLAQPAAGHEQLAEQPPQQQHVVQGHGVQQGTALEASGEAEEEEEEEEELEEEEGAAAAGGVEGMSMYDYLVMVRQQRQQAPGGGAAPH